MTAGFPNLFIITGPGSPPVLSNMVLSIEDNVNWVSACLEHLRARQANRIDATPEAESAWVHEVNDIAAQTLYSKANSWFVGANVPGKPRVFMPYVGGFSVYREKCLAVAANAYEGFQVNVMTNATA